MSQNENADDQWIQVEPEENVFVVNIGDMMSYFSNGIIKGRDSFCSANHLQGAHESGTIMVRPWGCRSLKKDLAGTWNLEISCNSSCKKFKVI